MKDLIIVIGISVLLPFLLNLITWAFQGGKYKDHFFIEWYLIAVPVLFLFFGSVALFG